MTITPRAIERFLQTIALAHIVVGAALPWLVETAIFNNYHAQLRQVFDATGDNAEQQARFLMGIFGPTIVSWGILFLYAVNSGFSRPTPQAWWFMLAACLAWAPFDSILSLQQGMSLNAIINAIAFPAIVLPLLLAKKHFHPPMIKLEE